VPGQQDGIGQRAVRRLIAAALATAILPVEAGAADRTVQVTSFQRLRVEAPVEVVVTAGSPRATVSGDPRAAEFLQVAGSGGTLTVRQRPGGPAPAAPLKLLLSSPVLASITAGGGAKVAASGLRAARVDLALAGAGTLAASGIEADQLSVLIAGNGTATLSGRAGTARIGISGSGNLDADALVAGDLSLTTDGAGETRVRARYTARIANGGAGQVVVAGTPKCVIVPGATGPVRCGADAP